MLPEEEAALTLSCETFGLDFFRFVFGEPLADGELADGDGACAGAVAACMVAHAATSTRQMRPRATPELPGTLKLFVVSTR